MGLRGIMPFMKKLILTALVFIAGSAVAQNYPKNIMGARIGFVSPWATSYGVVASPNPSFMISFSDQVLLTKSLPFYLETGLTFIGKGYKIKGHDESSTRFNYLQIPVAVNYHIYAHKFVTIEPSAGFYYACGLGGKRKYGGNAVSVFKDGSTSRHDLGFSCGLSSSIHEYHFGIIYEMGVLNIAKTDKIYGNDNYMLGYKKLKNRSIIIKAGMNF